MFSLPGVMGFGYGKKETNGQLTDKEALIVFVAKKLPKEQLQEHEVVPESIQGMETDVIEIGEVIAHQGEKKSTTPPKQDVLDKLLSSFWNQEIINLDHISGLQRILNLVRSDLDKVLFIKDCVAEFNLNHYRNAAKVPLQELSLQAGQDLKRILQVKDILLTINPKMYKDAIKSIDFFSTLKKIKEFFKKTKVVSRTSVVRPAPPGVSIGHYQGGAGTFGAIVYDKKSGDPLILSNNHVLANTSLANNPKAKLNDAILQPGPYDGQNKEIGKLTRYAVLNPYPGTNVVDCALAKPNNTNDITPDILDIGKIQGISDPVVGMKIKKSGRTTGLTTGEIRALDATIQVNYGNGINLIFENQIIATVMSQPGDSGSLVADLNNKAVGLLFAGSDQSTIINPIDPVLDLLEITL